MIQLNLEPFTSFTHEYYHEYYQFINKVDDIKFQYTFPSLFHSSDYLHATLFLSKFDEIDYKLGLDSLLCIDDLIYLNSNSIEIPSSSSTFNVNIINELIISGSIDRYHTTSSSSSTFKSYTNPLLTSPLPTLITSPTHSFPDYKESNLIAVVLVYDDIRFLESIIDYLEYGCEKVLVFRSMIPWNGERRDLSLVDVFFEGFEETENVEVIKGYWLSETSQRNSASTYIKTLSLQTTKSYGSLIIDGDEFWSVQTLKRIFKSIEVKGREKYNEVVRAIIEEYPEGGDFKFMECAYKLNWMRGDMVTYFGTIQTYIEPRELLKILFYVDQDCCEFVSHREIACFKETDILKDDMVIGKVEGEGLFIDESFGVCHHLSYVRTRKELVNKFESFEHSHELIPNWVENIWDVWAGDKELEDLHPTKPEAYKRTERAEVEELTVEIINYVWGRCYLPGDVDDDARDIICGGGSNEVVDDLEINLVIRPINQIQRNGGEENSINEIIPKSMTITKTGYIAEGSTLLTKHGGTRQILTVVDTNKIEENDIQILDRAGNSEDVCGKPEFLIFILCEGVYDESTYPVFSEIANALQRSVTTVLTSKYGVYDDSTRPAVIIRKCIDLRFCKIESDRYIIVLGIHHISRYTDESGNIASVIGDFPKRDRTVVYNFEEVGKQVDFERGRMKEVLKYYEPNVWDYSEGNIENLKGSGISDVKYVPMGYVPDLYPPKISSTESSPSTTIITTDVLFYGRLNNYRASVIKLLRLKGVNVRHINANSEGVWGDDLRREIDSAKIVLSLRYFKNQKDRSHSEWKFTRFYYPLIRGTLVVSEPSGTQNEMDYWKGGLVFAEVESMATVIKRYLRDEEGREEITKEGRRLLEQVKMEEFVEPGVMEIIQRRCNNNNQ